MNNIVSKSRGPGLGVLAAAAALSFAPPAFAHPPVPPSVSAVCAEPQTPREATVCAEIAASGRNSLFVVFGLVAVAGVAGVLYRARDRRLAVAEEKARKAPTARLSPPPENVFMQPARVPFAWGARTESVAAPHRARRRGPVARKRGKLRLPDYIRVIK